MPYLRLVRKPETIPPNEENKSHIIIGYAFVAVIQFLFGLSVGWLIWG